LGKVELFKYFFWIFFLKLFLEKEIQDHILFQFHGEKESDEQMDHVVSMYEDGTFEESEHLEFDDVTLQNPANTVIATSTLLFVILTC
jgi:hypothetical protein